MPRAVEHRARTRLDDFAAAHHNDAPRERLRNGEVVRDDDKRCTRSIDERLKKPHDFACRACVERACRFVGNTDLGL